MSHKASKLKFRLTNVFHIVEPSPYPILTSAGVFMFFISIIGFLHPNTIGVSEDKYYTFLSNFCPFLWSAQTWRTLAIFTLLSALTGWFYTIRVEAKIQGKHNSKVRKGLKLGFKLFIVSEIMLFVAFFWAFLYFAVNPSCDGSGKTWPPFGIKPMYSGGVPLLETILLFSSWYTSNIAVKYFKEKSKGFAADWLFITILLGATFLWVQFNEFVGYRYKINDGIYGSTFFMISGLHGAHVIVGIILLLVAWFRLVWGDFTPRKAIGMYIAIVYWHFVDYVWIAVFSLVYVWGNWNGHSIGYTWSVFWVLLAITLAFYFNHQFLFHQYDLWNKNRTVTSV